MKTDNNHTDVTSACPISIIIRIRIPTRRGEGGGEQLDGHLWTQSGGLCGPRGRVGQPLRLSPTECHIRPCSFVSCTNLSRERHVKQSERKDDATYSRDRWRRSA